nr:hypothetical protein [Tanacetum cinerariifolium]
MAISIFELPRPPDHGLCKTVNWYHIQEPIYKVHELLVLLLGLSRFEIPLGELEITSSGWPFAFAVHGLMTHLVASITLDSARSCVMQGVFLTQGTISSITTILSWGGSIRPDSFLSFVLLLAIIIVVVVVIVLVVVAATIRLVVVVKSSSVVKLLFRGASSDYVPASPGKTYSSSSNNLFGLVLIVSRILLLFYDVPNMKVMHAYYAKESPIPPPVIIPPSPMLSPMFNSKELFLPEELLPPKKR